MVNALQPADACLLVVDLSDPDCVSLVMAVHKLLSDRKIILTEVWPANEVDQAETDAGDLGSFTHALPTLLVAAKSYLPPDPLAELEALEELAGFTYPAVSASAKKHTDLGAIGDHLLANLEIIRVFTKIPGRPADLTHPFTVHRGETVADVARLVHRDMAAAVKYARVWGEDAFAGQQVGREHLVVDGDVLELHT
jgi:ribosome-interacting GTPase 1